MSYCIRCGNELRDSARVCAVCFLPRLSTVTRTVPQPPPTATLPAREEGEIGAPRSILPAIPVTDGGAVAALILGIAGVMLSWGSLLFIGVSIAAIVVGRKAEKRISQDLRLKGHGMARAGWWLGIAGTVIATLVTVGIVGAVISR